ncbi:hypothetical protein ACLIYM_02950 [Streptomyces fenghuangensis]
MAIPAVRLASRPLFREGRRRGRLARRAATGSVLALATALLLGLSTPAHAGGPYVWAPAGSIGKRLTICAQDLGVRHSKGGTPFAHLTSGQTFTVEHVDLEFGSEWVYGFAWGNVNARGYVQNGWFCNS